jgi:sugar phosphate isomerase/epimerase
MNPATVGLDLAKNVFHVHVADASVRQNARQQAAYAS